MGLNVRIAAASLALAFVSSAHAGGNRYSGFTAAEDAWFANQCVHLQKATYPKAHLPTSAEGVELKSCDPEDAYYGLGVEIDYAKARKCAFLPKGANQGTEWSVSVLAMVYANGKGVPRNYLLAQKAVCEDSEMDVIRKEELVLKLKELSVKPDSTFDVCDIIGGDVCATFAETAQTRESERALGTLLKQWTPAQREAFSALKKSAYALADLRAGSETDQRGSGRNAIEISARTEQKAEFLRMLQAFEAGRLPTLSLSDFVTFDAKLNQIYRDLMKMKESELQTVTNADLKEVQRTWLTYRDAWVRFGALRYPSVPAHSWRANFTIVRVQMLKEIQEERR